LGNQKKKRKHGSLISRKTQKEKRDGQDHPRAEEGNNIQRERGRKSQSSKGQRKDDREEKDLHKFGRASPGEKKKKMIRGP